MNNRLIPIANVRHLFRVVRRARRAAGRCWRLCGPPLRPTKSAQQANSTYLWPERARGLRDEIVDKTDYYQFPLLFVCNFSVREFSVIRACPAIRPVDGLDAGRASYQHPMLRHKSTRRASHD